MRANLCPLLKGVRDLMTKDVEKTDVPETSGKVWSRKDLPSVEDNQIREHTNKLEVHKSMGPDGKYPQVLIELTDVIEANSTPIFKKGKKNNLGNFRLVTLNLIPGSVMEKLILETISKLIQDRKQFGSGQHRFTKRKSCLINLIPFYDEMTDLVDKWRAEAFVYLDFSKDFDTLCHNILVDKLQNMSEATGHRADSCVRCDQADDLLCMVAELREEVERLRSIREAEKEIDWWCHALPRPRQEQEQQQPPVRTHDQGDPVPPLHRAEGSSSKEEGKWKQVHARGSRRTPSLPTSPPQVPLYNRYEALEVEGQAMKDEDDSPSTPEVLPRSESVPLVLTPPPQGREDGL
ncbi:hypothetical protein QYF61_026943 [Mycteria americana]|uniref:Reverse transcriptase domain-containing protein n=1 Tax=Mycteria americana TaxID=33587 RepID=A0AAN7NPB5_MYCAM|nr:hypothetical protein QYF61_026943 [Mycteria americana]